jgi:uncharacterized protein (TIGR03382 family)
MSPRTWRRCATPARAVTVPVPVPGSLTLAGLGLLALGAQRRR